MSVRVDNHRHHGLAGKIYASGALRQANISRWADLRDFCAIDNQCTVLN
jgi:hypothetical protein